MTREEKQKSKLVHQVTKNLKVLINKRLKAEKEITLKYSKELRVLFKKLISLKSEDDEVYVNIQLEIDNLRNQFCKSLIDSGIPDSYYYQLNR